MTSDQKLLLLIVFAQLTVGTGLEAELHEITTVGDDVLFAVAIAYAQVVAIVLIENVVGDATATGTVEGVLTDGHTGSVSKSLSSSCEECAKTHVCMCFPSCSSGISIPHSRHVSATPLVR